MPGDIHTISGEATDSILAAKTIQRERLQVLVLNAGSCAPIQDLRYLTWENFSPNWNVDVKAAFVRAREALLAPLDEGSTIIIVSSLAAGSDSTATSAMWPPRRPRSPLPAAWPTKAGVSAFGSGT